MEFIHLHVHTSYSMLDGYGLPHQYAKRLKEIGHDTMAITDHSNVWGHVPFSRAFAKEGLKIIFGCEFYVAEGDAQNNKTRHPYHITILAKNNVGLTNLHKLVTYSNFKGFYYKPRIDFKTLAECNNGLIVLSGCTGDGFIVRQIDATSIEAFITGMHKVFKNDFYMEVQPLRGEQWQHNAQKILQLAEDFNVPAVSTGDVHFPNPQDHSAQDVMLCIGTKDKYKDSNRMSLPKELYMYGSNEAERRGKEIYGNGYEELFEMSLEINGKCEVSHPKAQRKLFPVDTNIHKNANDYFYYIIQEGITTRNIEQKENKNDYYQRLDREINIIVDKNYVHYFLIIWDIVHWAKQRMLVGAGRGSVAGSLVAYVLGITEVDPVKHGLLFERFIDESRLDDPDIDLDFPAEKRDVVVDYIVEKYGEEHTALLGNLGRFKSKNSVWDVRRVFDLPWGKAKELVSMVLERSSGDARTQFCLIDSFQEFERAQDIIIKHPEFKLAAEIEGQIRQSGIHAAGVVLADDKLENYSGYTRGKNTDNRILSIDWKSMKYLNLLKIDILALKQLSIFETTLNNIGKDANWLYNIPIDDPEPFKLLREGKYWGIFQFEGDAVRAISKQAQPDSFTNICEISALARPGALHSGGTTQYIKRRLSKESPTYSHPLLEDIASDTYGIIIYQEQVMRIMTEIGNMSWSETTTVRIAMGKSMGVEYFSKFKKSFVTGAKENGLTENDATILWDSMQHFGSWAFNKSHSVSYGYISYWCLYLKAHYPQAFYHATLMAEDDEQIQKKILREYCESGGEFVPFDINKSNVNFSIHNGTIYGGWSNLKGIGKKTAENIVASRPWDNSGELRQLAGNKVLGALKTVDCLPPMKSASKQLVVFSGKVETDKFEDIKIGDMTKYDVMPWAELYPIGDKYTQHYIDKGHKITHADKITEQTESVLMIVKITSIQLYSMQEETQFHTNRQKYKNKNLDKYLKITAEDDTGIVSMGISRYKYDTLGLEMIQSGTDSVVAVYGKKYPNYNKIDINKFTVLKRGKEYEK